MPANPKIAFIGAGSTVFMKNIVGDVLQRPALAGADDRADGHQPAAAGGIGDRRRQADRDARRPGDGRDLHRPAPGARRAPTSSSSPSRSAATSPARSPISRCRRNTACARRSPTRSASAASCAACARCRICGRSARTCWRSAPTRSCCNTSTRWRSTPGRSRRNIRRSARSASAIRCRARRRNSPTISTFPIEQHPLPRRRHQPHGLLPQFRGGHGRRQPTATSIPTSSAPIARAARRSRGWNPRCPNKVRYEMLTRLGYFVTESSEHFAEYTPWFIKRDRPDLIEKFGIPLDEYPEALRRADRALEERRPRSYRKANTIEVKREPRICLLDHELGVDRRALGDLRQRPQQRLHHLAAGRTARSRCPASSTATASSRPMSAPCRRS